MITKTYHLEGSVSTEELQEFIREEGFFDNCYLDFTLKGENFVLRDMPFNPFQDQDCTPIFLSKQFGQESYKGFSITDFCSPAEFEEFLTQRDYIFKAVEVYEHSTFNFRLIEDTKTHRFTCPFDSGLGGYLIMKKSDLRKNRQIKKITDKILKEEFNFWKSILEEFTYYMNGNQYGLTINDQEDYNFNYTDEACKIIANHLNTLKKAS